MPDFDPAAIWRSWLVLRHWLVGASLAPHWRKPETRAELKPEAVWEIEGGLKLDAFAIHAASATRSAWWRTVCDLFERFDVLACLPPRCFRSRPGSTGRAASRGGRWTPTTAGWRWWWR